MRISDWSSDVCSSYLPLLEADAALDHPALPPGSYWCRVVRLGKIAGRNLIESLDRKSVVEGKSVSVRVDLGGRRIIKKQKGTQLLLLWSHNQERSTLRNTTHV